MEYRDILANGAFCASLQSETKEALLSEMVDLTVRQGTLPCEFRETALSAVLDREQRMSTGMQHGVAVPHGKTETMPGVLAVVGLKPAGIDFEALDGEMSRIFVMTLASSLQPGPHMKFLASIGRMLDRADIREALLSVRSKEEMLDVLAPVGEEEALASGTL